MGAHDSLLTFDESVLESLHELQVEGEPSFVGGLISDYLSQVPDLRERLRASQNSGDRAGLEKAAHKLKSSSAVLGLMKVATLCRDVEEKAHNGEETQAAAQELDLALTEACRALNDYRQNRPGA